MNTAELIGLVSTAPNAILAAALTRDAGWNVAEDWGLGKDWQVVRVPVGLKFRHLTNGLVTEEVVVAGGAPCERASHERLLALSKVPTRLVFVDRPHAPHNRLAPHFRPRRVGRDG